MKLSVLILLSMCRTYTPITLATIGTPTLTSKHKETRRSPQGIDLREIGLTLEANTV